MANVPLLAAEPEQPVRRTPETFMRATHRDPVFVDPVFLQDCGFLERFRGVTEQCGWPGLYFLQESADKEDTAEFLGTFTFDDIPNGNGISYRFRGQRYWCTLAEVREVFGWAEPRNTAYIDYSTIREQRQVWGRLTGAASYQPSGASARRFRDPFWFYMQFILSRTIHARANGNDKPNCADTQLLGHLIHGSVPDWAFSICGHWKTVRPTGIVSVGGMVTYFLRRRHPEIQARPTDTILYCAYADRGRVKSGRTFRVDSAGRIRWIYFSAPDLREMARDVSPPRGRGRPPLRGRGAGQRRRRREDVVDEEPLDAVPPEDEPPQQQPPPAQLQQAHIDAVFHMNRVSRLGIVPFLPAPPGWLPGMVIPPEYLQPPHPPPGH